MSHRSTLLCCLMAFGMAHAPAHAEPQAHFRIGEKVVNADVSPFTATITSFGNGARLSPQGGGFEPVVLRTMFLATGGSEGEIEAAPQDLTQWDSWRQGALDGAEVEVLRIENGNFVSVRTARVAEGGHHASGWVAQGKGMLPAGVSHYLASWDGFNRLDAPYYFMVRAVDGKGRLSGASRAVSVVPPSKPGKLGAADKAEMLDIALREGSALAAPQALNARITDRGVLDLSWEPVAGASGYVVYRSDYPPEEMKGYGLRLADMGPPVRSGDLVILRQKYDRSNQKDLVTNRLWNAGQASALRLKSVLSWSDAADHAAWELREHGADTTVSEGGETYLHSDLYRDRSLSLGLYNNAGTEQNWYEVLDPAKTYRAEFWMRGDPRVSATFTAENIPAARKIFAAAKDWTKYSVDFSPAGLQTDNLPWQMKLDLQGVGSVDIDNFRIYATDAPYLAWDPDELADLEASGMSMLRTHGLIKTGTATYDLTALLNAGGGSNISGGATLPQTLAGIEAAGMDPWLQIEPHLSREEWLGFAEYLAAPFDPETDDPAARPYAAKRVAQGHAAPWIDGFDHLDLELGNETWNGLFRPWVFPPMQDARGKTYSAGDVYGLYQAYVLSILQDSPWWERISPKLTVALGGWAINNYGLDAGSHVEARKSVTVADYIGGWDSDEGPVQPKPDGYLSVMAFAPQVAADREARARAFRKRLGEDVILGTYESGPGYGLNGLNGQKVTEEQAAGQEQVMKSAAAGAATLDLFLMRAAQGDRVQNFFTFDQGDYWKSHAKWYRGGQAYPSWAWLSLFNHLGTGQMLEVETLSVPTQSLMKMGRREALRNAPMVSAYATRADGRLSVFVINRMVPGVKGLGEGLADVRIDLPPLDLKRLGQGGHLTRYRINAPFTAQNIESDAATITQQDLPLPTDGMLEIPQMPPASAELYVLVY